MRLLLLGITFLVLSTNVFGQIAEFSFGGGPLTLSGEDLGSGYSMDAKWKFGFRVTLNNWRHFGHEFGYAYNRHELKVGEGGQGAEAGFAAHQGLYHFLAYATPEGSRVRPFAAGGGHFTNYVFPGTSVTQGSGETKFGLNYGGGIKFRVTDKWLVRIDAKQYWNGKPWGDFFLGEGTVRMNEISVGLAFTL